MKNWWLSVSAAALFATGLCACGTAGGEGGDVQPDDSSGTAHDVAAAASAVPVGDGVPADSPAIPPTPGVPVEPRLLSSPAKPAGGNGEAEPVVPPPPTPPRVVRAPGEPDAAELDSIKRAKGAGKGR